MLKTLALSATLLLVAGTHAFADGDAEAGEKYFKKCKACHMVGEEKGGKVGPNLGGLFGRTAGSVEGFKYSDAMIEAGEKGLDWTDGPLVWTDEHFATFMENPKKTMKGTKMAMKIKDAEDIANVAAYIKAHSGN